MSQVNNNKMMRRVMMMAVLMTGLFFFGTLSFNSSKTFAQTTNGPVMTFQVTTIDYGRIEKGADPLRRLRFTNTGNEPLIILSAKRSGGGVVATYPKEPTMPDESANIDVCYNTQRIGEFNKTVTLTTNEAEPAHKLTIKGEVKAPDTQESVPDSSGGDGDCH